LNEFQKYVAIAGFRKVKIENVDFLFDLIRERTGNVDLQIFDAKYIAGWQHLYFAAINALNASKVNRTFSRSLAMDILLFASATRQINKAVKMIGVKPKTSQIAILILAETRKEVIANRELVSAAINGQRDDSVLELNDEKIDCIRGLFHISDTEIRSKLKGKHLEKEALIGLVIERVALLASQH
jgi:KEOPS complex subunit Cgi121